MCAGYVWARVTMPRVVSPRGDVRTVLAVRPVGEGITL